MRNTAILHTRWCAYGLIAAIASVGCSSNTSETDSVAQTAQAWVSTTPININVTLPAGVNASSVLLSASDKLTINGSGTIGDAGRLTAIAGLGAGSQLLIQAGANVFGSVVSGSPITVSPGATVFGSVRSGSSVDVQPSAQVLGGATSDSAPGQSAIMWVVDWPDDAGIAVERPARNTSLGAGEPGEAIAPGRYSNFSIMSRNRITFSTGTYYIDDFYLAPEAEIMLDSSGGPVIVYVKNSLNYSGKFLPVRNAEGIPIAREGGLRAVYLGTNAAEITGPFVGLLVATNADIHLNSPNSGQHKGGFFGKNITVSANANSVLLPLDFDFNDFTRGDTKYGDGDDDKTSDDKDLCPTDPKKVEPGVCGCNKPDTDSDGDGIPNCIGTVGEFCSGKAAGTECYSTICPNNKTKEACGTNGVCGDPVAECAPGGGGSASGCYYKIFRTSVYWICNKNVTWQAAAAACREVPGRSLVQIDGRIENSWLDFITASSMWIGASSGPSGAFSWTQGTDDAAFPFWAAGAGIDGRFNHWQAGQPSGGGCGAIQLDGTWAATACGTTKGFICEQPLRASSPTGDGKICNFYPGETCPSSNTPSTCVPATDIMAGTRANFASVANDCYANCAKRALVGTPACDDHCLGILPIPSASESCTRPIGVRRPVCNIAQTGYGDVCQPNVTVCGAGKTCGRVYECAQLDASNEPIPCKQNSDCTTKSCHPTHKVCIDPTMKLSDDPTGTVWSTDTNKCFVTYHCGTPTEDSCDTDYFNDNSMEPCNEVEICNPNTARGVDIDPLAAANESNLGETVFDPDTAFQKPDAPVSTPFASAKPSGCGDDSAGEPPCDFKTNHPWCKAQVDSADNKVKSQAVTDEDSPDDKKGRSGGEGPLSFDFDPNLSLEYKIEPALFGDSSSFYVDAKASALAEVHLNNFLGFSSDIKVLDALGEIRVDRCGLKADAHTKLLGVDFLPTIMGDSYDDLHRLDTNAATRKRCEEGIAQFQSEVSRVAKALRDAQELIRQFKEAPVGSTLDPSFCAQVVNGFIPSDFPNINCATATPDQVVNAFIDYYQQQAVALAGKAIDSVSLPSFDGKVSGEIRLGGTEGRENQNLLNLPFAIGPIPMSLTVDAFLTYGISGGFQFGLTPDGFLQTLKNRDPAELAYARANAIPHAGAGIEMFVGAGFDCGFAAAKIGISGDVNVADITIPLTAGAYLNVRSESDSARPLPPDLQEANGSASYDVYFPPVGPSRFVFGAGYEYDASVHIEKILEGQINAQLKLKFLFFSKTWRAKIAEFGGMRDLNFALFSGKGGIVGALDMSGVNLGTVSMPVPFLKLPHVPPVPASAVRNVPFNPNRMERPFYDNQCVDRPAQECPRIFATVPSDGTWYDAEQSNYIAAYGATGFTLGNYDGLWSDYTGSTYNGVIAIGNETGVGNVGVGDLLGSIVGGKTLNYPSGSPRYLDKFWDSPAKSPGGIFPGAYKLPSIVLNASFPSTKNRPATVNVAKGAPVHLLPSDYAGTVTVQNGGILSLDGSGQYFFDNLRVLSGGFVMVNHGSSAVEIAIKGDPAGPATVWQGQIVNGNGRENAHVVGYYGTAAITLNSPNGFNGTFVAPNATVTLAPAYYHGAVYAKTLVVQPGAQIGFLPCHPWTAPPPGVTIM